MKYTTNQKKQEIIDIIADEFERVKHDLDVNPTKENYGRYQAFMDLLQKVIIYEGD